MSHKISTLAKAKSRSIDDTILKLSKAKENLDVALDLLYKKYQKCYLSAERSKTDLYKLSSLKKTDPDLDSTIIEKQSNSIMNALKSIQFSISDLQDKKKKIDTKMHSLEIIKDSINNFDWEELDSESSFDSSKLEMDIDDAIAEAKAKSDVALEVGGWKVEEKNSKEGSYDYDQIKYWLFK